MASPLHDRFALDPAITFLNHGSFGACPRSVIEAQGAIRARMESEPVRFFMREAPEMIDRAREVIARFVGAAPEDLVFVRNATQAVSTVLASLPLAPGDELLTTDHAYAACKNALDAIAARSGARVVVAAVPFPIASEQQVIDAIAGAATPRTKLALIDHVTSPTGLVFPVAEIVALLRERGIDTLVDGAHGPGMLPLDLDRLGAAYYTGNLHKWLCAPKGCAIFHVRRDRQKGLRPLVISHGARSTRPRPMLWEEFDWTGTDDPSPWICAPAALDALESMMPGGLEAVRAHNHELALFARDRLCDALGIAAPAPDSMIGSLASVPLPSTSARMFLPGSSSNPKGTAGTTYDGETRNEVPGGSTSANSPAPASAMDIDPLGAALFDRHHIEVPVFPWPAPPQRLLRVAAQVYVDRGDIERLVAALRVEGVAR